ncbi:MAG TPA: hypothetical protein VN832_02735 [Stellaceae bacterium]|nr:hypothetical protein [Stellaceae bacterium]
MAVDKTLASNRLIFEVRRDAAKYQRFRGDLEGTLAEYGLTQAELQAWRERDIRTLAQLGVHPYFLPQVSRLFEGAARNHNQSRAAQFYAQRMLAEEKSRG